MPHEPIKYLCERLPEEAMGRRACILRQQMEKRRSLRMFAQDPIPRSVLEDVLAIACSAPSGANKQPWSFGVVTDPSIKKEIRQAAEAEERANYSHRMPQDWLQDLAVLGTDWEKPYLENAPALIVVFKQIYGPDKEKHYYVNESVGLAAGFLISALHQIGLATLTHTPSPMDFLTRILERPAYERPYLLIPVGYPADEATVPNLTRKPFEEQVFWY